jgi:hypothetical protein
MTSSTLAWTTRSKLPAEAVPSTRKFSKDIAEVTASCDVTVRESPLAETGVVIEPVPPSLTGALNVEPPSVLYRTMKLGLHRSSSRSTARRGTCFPFLHLLFCNWDLVFSELSQDRNDLEIAAMVPHSSQSLDDQSQIQKPETNPGGRSSG